MTINTDLPGSLSAAQANCCAKAFLIKQLGVPPELLPDPEN
jgi:hypothetical protein